MMHKVFSQSLVGTQQPSQRNCRVLLLFTAALAGRHCGSICYCLKRISALKRAPAISSMQKFEVSPLLLPVVGCVRTAVTPRP